MWQTMFKLRRGRPNSAALVLKLYTKRRVFFFFVVRKAHFRRFCADAVSSFFAIPSPDLLFAQNRVRGVWDVNGVFHLQLQDSRKQAETADKQVS